MTTIFEPDPPDTRPVAVLDFEASALGPKSYPIEVAVAYAESGAVKSWLIAPTQEWRDHWRWDSTSATVHGIALNDLLGYGLPVEQVCRELAEAVAGYCVLSDNVGADEGWLTVLFRVVGQAPPCRLEGYWDVATAIAGEIRASAPETDPLRHAIADADARVTGRRHRAGVDAQRLAEILRVLLKSEEDGR